MVELSAGASVAIGVIVGLVSTSIQSVGLTLQRKSHLLEEEKEDHYERRPPYKRRRWQLGMLMFVVANLVGSTIQITTLPLPVLSTLQASGLVFNSICASIILSEPFTRYSLIGTILVAAGAVLIGTFGALTEPSHNLDQLLQLLGRRQFLLWMFGTAIIIASLLTANWFLKRIFHRPNARLRLIRGMFFGCVSGILSAHSLLIAKSAVELLVRTIIDRHNEFNRWQSWVILLALVGFALTQLYYMHRGLKLTSTSVLYPLVFCVYNIIAIIDGLIYFRQSSRLSNLHAGLIALGTVILLGGVVSLSWRLEENEEEPSSPHAHKGHVPPPRTVLTPGLGLMPGSMDDEPEFPNLEDEVPGLHGSIREQRKRHSVDERTPLLARAPTAPGHAVTPRSKKRPSIDTKQKYIPASPSPRRPTRRRRMTFSEQTDQIWNELNDRESIPSPMRRSTELERRPRSGTLPTRRKNSSWLNQMRRRSWWEGTTLGNGSSSVSQGKRPVGNVDPLIAHPDPEDGSQSDPDAVLSPQPSSRRGTWGFGDSESRRNQEGLGDWFKLKCSLNTSAVFLTGAVHVASQQGDAAAQTFVHGAECLALKYSYKAAEAIPKHSGFVGFEGRNVASLSRMDLWESTIQKFTDGLNSEEKSIFLYSKPEDILEDVKRFEETHRKSSKLRRISHRIQPVLNTFEEYGKGIDVLANSSPFLPPLWGSIRVLLQAARKYEDYFNRLVDMLDQIGDLLPRYITYSNLLQSHPPLHVWLKKTYLIFIRFVVRAKEIFTRSSIRHLAKGWASFDTEFESLRAQLRRCRENVEEEVKLATVKIQTEENERAQKERELAAESRKKVENLELILSKQKSEELTKWLGARKCVEERNLCDDRRVAGTCEWILRHKELAMWNQDPKMQLFWLHGSPGCGKSFLYCKILGYLQKEMPVMYFLFCGGDKERVNLSSLCRSWCIQLIEAFPEAHQYLRTLKDKSSESTSTDREIKQLLELLLQNLPACYLTLDALDECSDGDQFFQKMAFIPKRFKILITSRTPINTRKDLARIQMSSQSLEIRPELSKQDVDMFVSESLDQADFNYDADTMGKIRDRLAKCDGMFLWVRLMINELSYQDCKFDILTCLERLPEGLPEAYDQVIERINKLPKSRRLLALKILFWGITVRRPVSVREMRVLLAVQPRLELFDENRLVQDADALMPKVCHGLITLRGSEKKIFFAHFTVTEYLECYFQRAHIIKEIMASYDTSDFRSNHCLAVAVCMRYLIYDFMIAIGMKVNREEASKLGREDSKYALLNYAHSNWLAHASLMNASELKNSLSGKLGIDFSDQFYDRMALAPCHIPYGYGEPTAIDWQFFRE
ncbi:hypothetical protein CC78DRAFT_548649 [Lojkania enalia]|uniref:NACHT domain-containing protein n=1 Tax=Lojkania enalia TaxID=147567 RepID=A0A9P4MVJ9_9PLEO|nr:hypothetical protein CC78DRAFT_548649 [Didymosphaeria enalia]